MPEAHNDRERLIFPEAEFVELDEMKKRLKAGFNAVVDKAEKAKDANISTYPEMYRMAAEIAESYASLVRAQVALER